ncbi:MAG: M67 family metallopeptidase [Rhizorhabdus sp.]
MELTISRALQNEIRRAAGSSPDAEICGLLLGQGRVIEAVLPCANVAIAPEDSFEVDPAALIAAHRTARAGGPAVVGHYHSHPRGLATPSSRDAEAAEPGSCWIIVAGDDVRGWFAAGAGRFVPMTIVSPDNR